MSGPVDANGMPSNSGPRRTAAPGGQPRTRSGIMALEDPRHHGLESVPQRLRQRVLGPAAAAEGRVPTLPTAATGWLIGLQPRLPRPPGARAEPRTCVRSSTSPEWPAVAAGHLRPLWTATLVEGLAGQRPRPTSAPEPRRHRRHGRHRDVRGTCTTWNATPPKPAHRCRCRGTCRPMTLRAEGPQRPAGCRRRVSTPPGAAVAARRMMRDPEPRSAGWSTTPGRAAG